MLQRRISLDDWVLNAVPFGMGAGFYPGQLQTDIMQLGIVVFVLLIKNLEK
jgi:hypothetical protein